jgi:hypothetical protein
MTFIRKQPMNATLTQPDTLAANLDRFTARLVEIVQTQATYPEARAKTIAACAFIAIWAHTEEPTLKEALDRLMNALSQIK